MAEVEVPPAAGPPGRRRRGFAPRYSGWLTLPALAYFTVFFLGPMAVLVVFAFARQSLTQFGKIDYGVHTETFHGVFDSLYYTVFWHTLIMAGAGTLFTILFGYPLAYWMARYLTGGKKSLALVAIVIPFLTSFLIRTYSWLVILDPQGYLARGLRSLGLVGRFDVLFTWKAIGIGLIYNYLPLLVLPVYASLERMDWSLVEAATDLGATPARAFRQVTLRLTLPGLITGTLLVFIPMCGEYVVPEVLGGGNFQFVGSIIASNFLDAQNQPFGSALSLALMAVLSAFVVLYLVIATREEQFGA
jgi:spermidine/putrescine transport system permease protein